MTSDICHLSAWQLAAAVRGKELSPVEIVRAHLERIERANPRLNAIVTMMPDVEARARAAEAAVTRGDVLGPLHGVPFTIKDCVDTVGVRTTRGSRLFAGHVPDTTATVVARLEGAGAVPLAKTNLPEFALWWETENLAFGRTVNPWNAERTADGSSGGEAAAIAARLSPLGIGSDVAGSIRGPAHSCGIVGLKATHGRIPLTGHWPETLLRFMHVGPMARTVEDVALAFRVMAGPDERDWYSAPVPIPGTSGRGVEGLRVGWMAAQGFGPVDPEIVATVARAAQALGRQGALVGAVELGQLAGRDWNQLSMTLFATEGGPYFAPIIAGREHELHPVLHRRLAIRVESLPAYVEAETAVEALRRELADYFTRWDLLLCPPGALPAHRHGLGEVRIGGHAFPPRTVLPALVPFDVTGSPALVVPFAASRDGLPIGVQLVGRRFDEATVLRAGLALEAVEGAGWRPPPV